MTLFDHAEETGQVFVYAHAINALLMRIACLAEGYRRLEQRSARDGMTELHQARQMLDDSLREFKARVHEHQSFSLTDTEPLPAAQPSLLCELRQKDRGGQAMTRFGRGLPCPLRGLRSFFFGGD